MKIDNLFYAYKIRKELLDNDLKKLFKGNSKTVYSKLPSSEVVLLRFLDCEFPDGILRAVNTDLLRLETCEKWTLVEGG
jgi:hypothetical protein